MLHYRSPVEQTPDFRMPILSHTGDIINFKSKAYKKGKLTISRERRFHNKNLFEAERFPGPASYNAEASFKNQVLQKPTSAVIKPYAYRPARKAPQHCMMVGQQVKVIPTTQRHRTRASVCPKEEQ